MNPRLYSKYHEEVKLALRKDRNYSNLHQVPCIEKIIVHMGLDATLEKSALEDAMNDMKTITGRKPVVNLARKSVSNFKLREGMPIGCHVTLRREVMYEFLDRLTAVALPRIRDFRGINPKSFDGQGNYSMGITEQSIFPEIEMDKVKRTQGMDVTIVTSAGTNDEALDLLTRMGMPFAGKKAVGESKEEELSKPDEVADLVFTACKGVGTEEGRITDAVYQIQSREEWDAAAAAFSKRHPEFHEGDLMKCLTEELSDADMETHVLKPLRERDIKILDAAEADAPAPKSKESE